ncbi:MAG TPA: hypothetical protein DCK98_09935 [Chloroflexi bacterium]|jgi:hypothetical protein|nr:hypothetical protein [Chloroflexota bacterium]HAL26362.1 hypothetical protein [Chloroflexota bacterium]
MSTAQASPETEPKKRRAMTSEPTSVDPIQAARAEVDRLFAIERRWAADRKTKAAELAQIERDRGERILEANGDGEQLALSLATQVTALRVMVETCDATIAAARRQRAAAIPYVWRAEAAQLERQADEKAAEAAAHGKRTAELLAELKKHEGADYVPAYLVDLERLQNPQHARGAFDIVLPKSQHLADQIAVLREKAAQPLGRSVVRGGMVRTDPNRVGQQPDELLELAIADPMRLAPPILELEAWIERASAADAKRRALLVHHGAAIALEAPTVYELVWQNERISEGESSVRPAHLDSENVATGERMWG